MEKDKEFKCKNYMNDAYPDSPVQRCDRCNMFQSKRPQFTGKEEIELGRIFYEREANCPDFIRFCGLPDRPDCFSADVQCGSIGCMRLFRQAIQECSNKPTQANCRNYVKLKHITVNEVGQKFWDSSIVCNCTKILKQYTSEPHKCLLKESTPPTQCGSIKCIQSLCDFINRETGSM
jgi:hypothetical protein